MVADGNVDTISFDWDAGGSGTMRVRWEGAAVAELTAPFDS